MIRCSRRNASPFISVDTYSRVKVCKLVGSFASLIRPAIAIAKSETSIRRTIFGAGWMSGVPLAVVNLDLGKKKGNMDKEVEDGVNKDRGVVGNTTHTCMVTAITASAINQLVRTSGQQFRNYIPR